MGNRYYPVGDKELASVTTITGIADKSGALMPWAVNCAVDYISNNATRLESDPLGLLDDARKNWREVRDEAGDIGTQVHDALEGYLKTVPGNIGQVFEFATDNKQALALFEAAVDKLNELGEYKVLATEQKVVNEDEWYAGRFDALLEVDGETWLIDFKTGASFYPEWGMQLAAYAAAWDTVDKVVDRTKILRLDKKTLKAHWKDYSDRRSVDYRAFLGLRDAFYILKAKKSAREAFLNGTPTD